MEAIRRHLRIEEKRDYGGNLLAVIHPHLRLEEVPAEDRRAVLAELLAAERRMLEKSFYSVVVAGKA
jgi:hypothetical protein